MKIAFINPKGTIFSKDHELSIFLEQSVVMGSFRHFWSAPCLGLLAIAAYVPEDWEQEYIDENYRTIDFEQQYDIVCVSAMTVQSTRAYEIIEEFKKKGILCVMGGIHATVLPEEALEHADVVIAGEGELLFPEFITDFIMHRQKRLYKGDGSVVYDLKNCTSPKYELIKEYDYPVINLYTTRGCPRNCSFCCASNVYGTKYRSKENQQILKELAVIDNLFPDRLILFADDNMFVMRRKVKDLLRAMIPLNVRYIAQTDISISEDDELLELMAKAGCQWIVIGFESVSENSLMNIDKNSFKYKQFPKYEDNIKKIQSYGIAVYGTFIVGLDDDSTDIFSKTADFIVRNNLYGANITVPTPLPGTKLREQLLEANRVLDYHWDYYTLWDVVIKPNLMSISQLKEGILEAYRTVSLQSNAKIRLADLLQRQRDLRNKKYV